VLQPYYMTHATPLHLPPPPPHGHGDPAAADGGGGGGGGGAPLWGPLPVVCEASVYLPSNAGLPPGAIKGEPAFRCGAASWCWVRVEIRVFWF
jgi:hypothetical protein